jgi:hypothetical protein
VILTDARSWTAPSSRRFVVIEAFGSHSWIAARSGRLVDAASGKPGLSQIVEEMESKAREPKERHADDDALAVGRGEELFQHQKRNDHSMAVVAADISNDRPPRSSRPDVAAP